MYKKQAIRTWIVLAIAAFVVAGSMAALATPVRETAAQEKGGLYGGRLKVALNSPVSSLDAKTATDDMTWNVLYRIFDTLLVLDKTTGAPVPWLTKDIGTWTSSGNKLSVTLKDNIKYHDGTTMTAADVKASFTALKTNARFSTALSHVTDISTSGSAVTFTLDAPYAPFYIDALAKVPIMPSGVSPSKPVGSGPFKFASKDSAVVKLDKFDTYFYSSTAAGPYIDGIDFTIYSGANATSDALDDIKAGTLDYMMWAMDTTDIRPGIPIATTQDFGFYYMGSNLDRNPISDTKLRYALAMCVDKKTTVVQSISNFGTIGSAVVSKGNDIWFNDSVKNDYAWIYDITGDGKVADDDVPICLQPVKDNLDAAGYLDVNGDGRRDKPGSVYPGNVQSFNLTALVPSSALNANEDRVTSSVIINMRNVGITMIDDVFKKYSDRDSKVASGSFDIYFDQYMPSSSDPSYLYNMFHTSGTLNKFGYSNPTVDTKLVAANKEMDITKRAKIVKEIQGIIAVDNPISVIYYPYKLEAKSGAYEGWVSMTGGIGNIWSFMAVHKPMIGSLDTQVVIGQHEASVKSGAQTQIKVTVKSGESFVPGANVEISTSDGTLDDENGLSDANGSFETGFTAPVVNSAMTITLNILATATQYNSIQTISYITVTPTVKDLLVTMNTSKSSVDSEGKNTVTVMVKDKTDNKAVSGATVMLSVLYLPLDGVVISPATATTDSAGQATFEFSAKVDTDTLYTISATVTKANYTTNTLAVAQIQVNGVQQSTGNIPGFESVGFMVAVCIAFAGVSVYLARRRK